jgi:nitrate reductase gamma subunit
MNILLSLVAVVALLLAAILGVEVLGLQFLFGVVLPYVAILVFLGGMIYRVVDWAKSPVPFRIPTTSGQEKSFPWIKSSRFDNPHDGFGVVVRMALEVLFFRSLFKNTRTEIKEERAVYGPDKWLWLGALAFHYSFLVVFLRHMRFFTEPVPSLTVMLQALDGFFQVGVPVIYASSFILLAGLLFLFFRRVLSPQVRYISLASDYFPLFLIIGIGTTGVILRHLVKTDIVAIKELGMGLLSFKPVAPDVHWLFYGHIFLVSVLFMYFPFSKLVHMGGVFFSPTRNLANNNRMVRHINPWNAPVKVHTYEEYEDEFREKMIEVGIPVDRTESVSKE